MEMHPLVISPQDLAQLSAEYNDSDDDLNSVGSLDRTGPAAAGDMSAFLTNVRDDDFKDSHEHKRGFTVLGAESVSTIKGLNDEYDEFEDDKKDHKPFTVHDHHHHIDEFDRITEDEASVILLQGIEEAERDNDEGKFRRIIEGGWSWSSALFSTYKYHPYNHLTNQDHSIYSIYYLLALTRLYRGQKLLQKGEPKNAIIQLERGLEHYRHLRVLDDDSISSSTINSTNSKNAETKKQFASKEDEEDELVIIHGEGAHEDRLDLSSHIYSMLVEAYVQLNNWTRAQSVAREWLEKYPKSISSYCSLAHCLREQGQFQDCIVTCDKCIRLLPETLGMLTIHNIRGTCNLKLEHYEEAAGDFKTVKEMSQKNLGRFEAIKPQFFSIDKVRHKEKTFRAPKGRPDIMLLHKTGSPQMRVAGTRIMGFV